ncbi:aquaporin-like protein [Jackrogersella minutella]|nr:aquaporin-like protein [Jackrogersella minutella]
MASIKTDPEGNEHPTREEIAELPDSLPDTLPNASRRTSDVQDTIIPREPVRIRNSNTGSIRTVPRDQDGAMAPINRAQAEAAGWVDEDYYKANPWYGQAKKKPVFSLGRPLPRKTRWVKRRVGGPSKPASNSAKDLAELGEAGISNTAVQDIEKAETTEEGETPRARRTAAGAAHSEKRNDVGQPVFEYLPVFMRESGDDDESTRRERTNDTQDTGKSNKEDRPKYGIDSEPLGKRDQDEVEQGEKDPNEMRNWWARIRAKHPEPLAEFLATGIAVFMGLGATLSVNLSAGQEQNYGSYETSCWAWGFAWMFGIYLGGGVSGAHMNPAISISLWLFRGFPWRSCLIYVLVQFLASIVAGALAYGIYRDSIRYVDPTMTSTAKSFFSSPQEWVSPGTAFFDQVVGSAIMMIAVFALGDDANNPPGAGMHALVLGLLLTTLKFTLGYNVGSALNPASDFGPRVVAWAVGYRGTETFGTGWWFYGPWLATILGSFIGCTLYDGFVFVGTESPINCRIPGGFKKRTRRLFDFTTKK